MRISRAVAELAPSGIRKFFDIVSQMDDVISLGVGEPDFITPWRIRDAAIDSLERGFTQYTGNSGLPALRREISRYLHRVCGIDYHPDGEVLVTVGVSEGLDLALRALLNPGDEVLIPEPCYVSYAPCTLLAGGHPVRVTTTAAGGFIPTVPQMSRLCSPRTRVLLLNYPNNPTGCTFNHLQLEEIARFCIERGLVVISDEIYSELSFERPHISIGSMPGMRECTLVLNGFSKAFAMTGWRLAYAAGPRDVIGAMTRIHQYTMLCAPITAQMAAIEALKCAGDDVRRMVESYNGRRRLVVSRLRSMGLNCVEPEGAFYAFPDVSATGLDGETFAERLLHEERVAVVPGSAFGEGAKQHVRLCYATGEEQLVEALDRMERFVRATQTARRESLTPPRQNLQMTAAAEAGQDG